MPPESVDLHVGDCLPVLATLPLASVDALVTDPPYGDARMPRSAWKQAAGRTYDGPPADEWVEYLRVRLEAARLVLKAGSPVAVAIGDTRVHDLARLLLEVWPGRELVTIAVDTGTAPPRRGVIHRLEYVLIAIEAGTVLGAPGLFASGEVRTGWAGAVLSTATAAEYPNQVYPVWVDVDTHRIVGVGRSFHQLLADGLVADTAAFDYTDVEPVPEGCVSIWPITRHGRRAVWRLSHASAAGAIEAGTIRADPPRMPGSSQPFVVKHLAAGTRRRIEAGEIRTRGRDERGALIIDRMAPAGSAVPTLWQGPRYQTERGTLRLRELLGDDSRFAYPQAPELVADLVQAITQGQRGAVVLDPFAGSGTLGDAILQLNAADGGSRRAVLIEEDEGTAELARRRVTACGTWRVGRGVAHR